MNTLYLETHFRPEPGVSLADVAWPPAFSIISACATTGEQWTKEQNDAADQKLKAELLSRSSWLKRVVGYSPTSGHAEPSWAAALSFEDACNLGLEFKQDAIYYVMRDDLFVSYCDDRRQLVAVGRFRERLHISEERDDN